jgi:hypothetical protein
MSVAEIVKRAEEFPIDDVIACYAREEGISLDVARRHAVELKRFLALHAINPEKRYGMRGPLDELWHTFLLFSKTYQDFCNTVAGRFIHHIPSPATAPQPIGSLDEYSAFLEDYKLAYQAEPPAELWPRQLGKQGSPNFCAGCEGCSVCGGVLD